MQSIWQDLRYGLRGLANRPSFTLLAILNLALGIGAATTIFSVIQNVLLDPFPYTDAERVVAIQIHDTDQQPAGRPIVLPDPEFLDYQNQNHVFEEVIGGDHGRRPADDAGRHRTVQAAATSPPTSSSSSACRP